MTPSELILAAKYNLDHAQKVVDDACLHENITLVQARFALAKMQGASAAMQEVVNLLVNKNPSE